MLFSPREAGTSTAGLQKKVAYAVPSPRLAEIAATENAVFGEFCMCTSLLQYSTEIPVLVLN